MPIVIKPLTDPLKALAAEMLEFAAHSTTTSVDAALDPGRMARLWANRLDQIVRAMLTPETMYTRRDMANALVRQATVIAEIAGATEPPVSTCSRSLRDSIEAYRVELLHSNPPVAHVLGMLLEKCE